MEESNIDIKPLSSVDDQRFLETTLPSAEKDYDVIVKEEVLVPMYGSLEDYVRDDAGIHIKDQLENNLLRDSSIEHCPNEIEEPESDVKVKEEVLSSICDPLDSSTVVDAALDIKRELENNLLGASQSECFTTEIEDSKPDDPEISTIEEHPVTVKPYECDLCDKAFHQSSGLVKHKRTHTGKKPYVCDVCNKAFIQKSQLVLHKRIHTGEKPYGCDVCNKACTSSSDLIKHRRIHTGEKPYVCEICNKAFTQKYYLVLHKRTHTGEKPYVCDVCKKAFIKSSDLAKHKRIHTGEKPHICDVCNKAFSHLSTLVPHKRTHTGEKPYVCDICYKAFTSASGLLAHKRTHNGEKPYGRV